MDLKEHQEHCKELLLRDDMRNAFKEFFQKKYPTMDKALVNALNNPTPGTWNLFERSEEYKALQDIQNAPVVCNTVDDVLPLQELGSEVPCLPISPIESLSDPPKVIPFLQSSIVCEPQLSNNGHGSSNSQDVIAVLAKALEAHGLTSKTQEIDDQVIADIAAAAAFTKIESMVEDGYLVTENKISITFSNAPEPVKIDGIAPKWFSRALKYATLRKNILLVGPSGAGKTYGAEMIAKALNLPFSRISLSGGTDEGQLQGWLFPIGDHGRFEYVSSVTSFAYENGGVLLLDEIDASDNNAMLIANAMMDNGQWMVPLRHLNPQLKKHQDFIVIAAANTHGHGANRTYVGRNQLDGATLDRFRCTQINCDYDEDMEKVLYCKDVVKYGHRLRARCRDMTGWTRDVSTRNIKDANDLISSGMFNVEEAWYGFFSDWKESELTRVSVVLDHEKETAVLR